MPTYGNSGNRWWVGQNVGETGGQQTALGGASILQPFTSTPSGYESLPSGNATDDALFAAAAKHNAGSKSPNTINVENIKWYNIQGPFTTQAAANAAIPGIQSANPAQGALAQEANAGNPVASPVAGAANNATTAIKTVADFLQGLTSANLWVRVAKVVIGGALLMIGVAKLTHLDQKASGIAKQAIKVAPFL